MIRFFPFIILLLLACSTYSQVDSSVQRVNFLLRQERERNWQERLHIGIYKEEGFSRYVGTISQEANYWFKYNEIYLRAVTDSLTDIFTAGLIYPSIFGANTTGAVIRYEKFPDDISHERRIFSYAIRFDSITITNVEEIKHGGNDHKTRSFYFLQYNNHWMNPTEFYFDLTNDTATKETSTRTFIKGARLTYFKKGGILI